MYKLAAAAIVLGSIVFAPALASADQCAFVTPEQSHDAVALIEVGSTIVDFCQPCGDAPRSVKVTSVTEAETGFEGTWEVSVNGRGIDLAYTFIENGDGSYVNLSKMVECPSEDVACMLDSSFAPQAASGPTCDGAKEDDLGDTAAESGGCNVGRRAPAAGSFLLAGLAVLGFALRRRQA